VASSVIPIDDLVYSYDDGNKLMIVKDLEHISAGYDDIHTTTGQDDFDYDTYGNLILNKDKDIIAIDYNHLNLPTEITFGNGGTIEYLYDAVGIKLKKTVTDGTNIDVTEYIDGFQYTGTQTSTNLDFFPTAEGYVKVLISGFGTNYNYVFQYMDHLGNIRMKYAQDPQNNNALTILEEDHYYPYGLTHKGYNGNHRVFDITGGNITLTPVNSFLGDTYTYGFGGKEQQEEFGIAMYDFGARNYDPALGRWMNVDPLAELMRRHSPYNYAFNNPMFFVDPDGMLPGDAIVNTGYSSQKQSTLTGSVYSYGTFDTAGKSGTDYVNSKGELVHSNSKGKGNVRIVNDGFDGKKKDLKANSKSLFENYKLVGTKEEAYNYIESVIENQGVDLSSFGRIERSQGTGEDFLYIDNVVNDKDTPNHAVVYKNPKDWVFGIGLGGLRSVMFSDYANLTSGISHEKFHLAEFNLGYTNMLKGKVLYNDYYHYDAEKRAYHYQINNKFWESTTKLYKEGIMNRARRFGL